jgi:hypothetical protein
MITRRATRLLPILAVVSAACGASPGEGAPDEVLGETREAIVNGSDSDASQNAVVLVIHTFQGGFEACSGTLLAPTLVLTARHCVAKTSQSFQCSATGETEQGSVSSDFDPRSVLVFGGTTRPTTQGEVNAASAGTKTFDDGARTLCNHDLALLLLDKPVAGAVIAPIRLDGVAGVGETVTLVGWGETTSTALPPKRQQRSGVKVIGSGTADGLGSSEFVLGEGSCEGDSGGPALAASGAVVGASSRGGNSSNQSGVAGCVGAINIYTAPQGFKSIVLAAYSAAGQDPWIEGQPNPTLAKDGAACNVNGDCQSNACSTTSHTCSPAAPTNGSSGGGGCAVAGPIRTSNSAPMGAAIALACVSAALGLRRRGQKTVR